MVPPYLIWNRYGIVPHMFDMIFLGQLQKSPLHVLKINGTASLQSLQPIFPALTSKHKGSKCTHQIVTLFNDEMVTGDFTDVYSSVYYVL